MISTALAASLFVWSYAVTCTSAYAAARAFLLRRRAPPLSESANHEYASHESANHEGANHEGANHEYPSHESANHEYASRVSGRRGDDDPKQDRSGSSVEGGARLLRTARRAPTSYGALRAGSESMVHANAGGARIQSSPRVLIVRPCAGLEPDLDRALASTAEVRSSVPFAVRFAVESASDPAAIAAAREAARMRRSGLDASVVLTAASAPNHKAAQIEAVLAREAAPHDAVVIADSDVDLGSFDLDRLVGPLLRDERAGAIWAPPVEKGAVTASGDRASQALLSASLHAFTLLGALDGAGLVGKLFAIRSDAIRAVGGFAAVSCVLGEDMELARLLREQGRTIRVAPQVARSLKSGRTWQSAVDRYARWLTVIRAQRPHLLSSYPLLFTSAPLILAFSMLLLPFAWKLATATLAITLITRLLVAIAARRLAHLPFSPLGSLRDAALSDALLTTAFLRALSTRNLTWRGRPLTLDRTGALTPL